VKTVNPAPLWGAGVSKIPRVAFTNPKNLDWPTVFAKSLRGLNTVALASLASKELDVGVLQIAPPTSALALVSFLMKTR